MSDESTLADIAQRMVKVLGSSNVALALGCRGTTLPNAWRTRSESVHPYYTERLQLLDQLFTQLSEATSPEEAVRWLTTFNVEMESNPLSAIRFHQFLKVKTAAAAFVGRVTK